MTYPTSDNPLTNRTIDTILARKSVGRLVEPGPTNEELALMLKCAANAPDHGGLRPFKFIILHGSNKEKFTGILEDALHNRENAKGRLPTPGMLAKEQRKLQRAPTVIVCAAHIDKSSRIPVQEQLIASAASVENLLISAKSLGYDTMWRTGEVAYDPQIKTALGLSQTDQISGWIYIGTNPNTEHETATRDPDLTGLVTWWGGQTG